MSSLASDRRTNPDFSSQSVLPYKFTDPDGRRIKLAGTPDERKKTADAVDKVIAKPEGVKKLYKTYMLQTIRSIHCYIQKDKN